MKFINIIYVIQEIIQAVSRKFSLDELNILTKTKLVSIK